MEKKKRHPIVAALLSLVFPGLGQLYNGQLKKAIIFFAADLLLPLLLFMLGFYRQFYLFTALLLFWICLTLFIIGEAFLTASRKKEVVLKPYNKWYVYLLLILLTAGSYVIPRDFYGEKILGFSARKIPTGSMKPTLDIGDRIIIDLKYFRKNDPQRGELIVFKFPQDLSKDFVDRIIAREGEKIEVRDRQVYINDEAISEPYKMHGDDQIESKPDHYFDESNKDNFGPEIVPDGHCFVLGDNRDNSYDSRYWGFLPLVNIKGKPLYVYWARDKSRIGKKIE